MSIQQKTVAVKPAANSPREKIGAASAKGGFRLVPALRKGVFFIHLWLGLLVGLYVVVMGLTGSLLVFQEEIDHALNPRLHHVQPQGARKSLDALLVEIRQRYPQERINGFSWEPEATAPYRLFVGKRNFGKWSVDRQAVKEVFVNPYSGEVLGERPRFGEFFNFVFYVHHDLLLGEWGLLFNGVGGLLWALIILSGLWLWWPSLRSFGKQLRARLTVQRGASYKRLIHDLHNVTGMYPLALTLLLSLTGAVFCFWEPVQKAVYQLTNSPAPESRRARANRLSGGAETAAKPPQLTLDRALEIGRGVEPEAEVTSVQQGRRGGPFRVTKEVPLHRHFPQAFITLELDPATGKVLKTEDSRKAVAGAKVMSWVVPLHFGLWGKALGGWVDILVRVLYVLAGLAPTALFVTGLLKYVEKRKAKLSNRKRRQEREQATA